MAQQLAPSRVSRALRRLALPLPSALVLAWAAASPAQQPPAEAAPPAPPAGDATAAPAGAAVAAQKGILDPGRSGPELEERYEDPKAPPALAIFRDLYTTRPTPTDRDARALDDRINQMAAAPQTPDSGLINSYIQTQLRQISARRNLEAIVRPGARPEQAKAEPALIKAVEDAGARLARPLHVADRNRNSAFRGAYTRALLRYEDDVLANHLYARLMYMAALSRSGDPQAIPLFARVLRDPEQPLAVQMLAAVGLTAVAGGGTRDVSMGPAIDAAGALTEFLGRNRGTFWPAQFRALQALGSLRLAGSDPTKPDPDVAALIASFLADPRARPAVRAWAAWALGMLRFKPQSARFNFQLIVHHIGREAVDLGQQIAATDVNDNDMVATRDRLTDLLIQIALGLDGEPAVRDSGLLRANHPNLAAQRKAIDPIAGRVRAVVRAAVGLERSAGQARGKARDALAAAVEDLLTYLEQAPPPDVALYPGGPEFPIAKAGAPGRHARGERPGRFR